MSKKTKAPAKKTPAPKAKKTAAEPSTEATTPRENRNDVTRPAAGTLCAKVWDALDSLKTDGKEITFDAVRELAGKEMTDATIRTQRQRWNKFTAYSPLNASCIRVALEPGAPFDSARKPAISFRVAGLSNLRGRCRN